MQKKRLSVKIRVLSAIMSLVLIVLDQWTKYLAVTYLKPVGFVRFIPNVLNLFYLENRGAAFGLFSGQRWVFLIITAVIIFVGIYLLAANKIHSKWLLFTVHLIVAGGIGNMIDRMFRGGAFLDGFVVDFLQFQFIDFPVFNLADCFVTVGSVMVICYLLADIVLSYRQGEGTKAGNHTLQSENRGDSPRSGGDGSDS